MIDLMAASLIRHCQGPGCPMCTARRQAEAQYIEGILWEGVSDGDYRAKLKRSLGFCPPHAWAFQATEDTHWNDGLGTALIYADLTRRVVKTLAAYEEKQAAQSTSGLRGWLTRLWRSFWPSASARTLPKQLLPQQMCPVCDIGQAAEKRFVHTLLDGYQSDEVRTAFCRSDGLCLGHLRQTLAQANPGATAFLVGLTLEKLRPLAADLAEYERKQAWHFRDEPKCEREQHAWVRAVAFFAGEAVEAELERIYEQRRRALEVFHTTKQEG
jgi:hypothetical protein